MHETNLNDLSVAELKALRKDIDKALENVDARKGRTALAAVEAAVGALGYSFAELVGGVTAKFRKPARPAMYQHPDDRSQTWSGRGRKPFWIKELEAAGRPISDVLIEK